MKSDIEKISIMQTEVWKMKDKVYKDTKGMDSRTYFKYVTDRSRAFRLGQKKRFQIVDR